MEEITLTREEAKAIDRSATRDYGILPLVLMENAGRAVAEEAFEMLKAAKIKRAAIFAGKGNNGGDAFVASRHLKIKGIKARIYLAGKRQEVKNEALVNLNILEKMREAIYEISNLEDLAEIKEQIKDCQLIIDGLLGTGLSGRVHEPVKSTIDFLNSTGVPILSIDIPSGLDADSGKVLGSSIRAKKTITFMAKKKGFFINDGPLHSGSVVVADIGIPRELIEMG